MANTKVTSNVISDDIALGGNPTTTTQSAGNNTTRIATTAFVKAAIDATIDSAPGALDTLNELAAAIGDDANFSTTITNSIATKAALAGAAFTGGVSITSGNGDQVVLNNAGERFTQISLQENSTTRGALWVDGTDNFVDLYANTSHGIRLKTGGDNTRVTVKDDGKVGIGASTVDELLHIEQSSGTTLVKTEVAANSTVGFEIAKTGSTTQSWRIADGQTVNGALEFHDLTNTATRMIIRDGKVGIGESNPLGWLHVKEGDSGQGSVNSNFDQLVIEDDAHSGISILSGTSSDGAIYFGDSGANNRGQFKYRHSDDSFGFITADGGGYALILNSDDSAKFGGDVLPSTDSTYDLGSNSLRWANIFTGDLHLSNEGSGGNEVDGTSGDWTIQEGEDHLYIKNNKSGKKYRFALEEIE